MEEMNLELCQKMDEPKRKKKSRLGETLHAKEWSKSQTLKQSSQGTSRPTVRLWSRVEDDGQPEEGAGLALEREIGARWTRDPLD